MKLLQLIYPSQCMLCDARVTEDFALCGACFAQMPFTTGLHCDRCAVPLPGHSDQPEHCDHCSTSPPPWDRARATLMYDEAARDLILRLKHGDRTDLAKGAGAWMAQDITDLLRPDTILAPVPLHWTRLLRRRYNQSALLAQQIARDTGTTVIPDLFRRPRRTPSLDRRSAEERETILTGAIRCSQDLRGRHVIIVDDVMTTGATLRATAHAAQEAGAASVDVAVLARVAKSA